MDSSVKLLLFTARIENGNFFQSAERLNALSLHGQFRLVSFQNRVDRVLIVNIF